MPKVSIIVPVYNAQRALNRCVDSVLAQTFEDFELILADDGSTDGSPQIIDDYAARDPRVRPIHKPNTGVSDTRNTALDQARGTYVQFLDSDDWIAPEATQLMVRAMEDHDADMVVTDFYRVIGSRTARKGDIDAEGTISREDYADYMMEAPSDFYYGVLWNKLYKRMTIELHNLRMDPKISWCEDFIFNMEYVLHTRRIYPLQVPLYYYVKTEGSLVEQSAGIAGTVRMKLAVIEYYKKFYQSIYDEDDYQRRRLDVYRFFLTSAGDGGALPGPNTKRLGLERTPAYVDPDMRFNPLADLYLQGRMLDRCLERVASQFDLDLKDVRLLVYLRFCGTAGSRREMADYVGSGPMAVAGSLSKLRSRGWVTVGSRALSSFEEEGEADGGREGTHGGGADRRRKSDERATDGREPRQTLDVALAPDSAAVMTAVDDALRDFRDARCSGLTDHEREVLLSCEAKAFGCLAHELER